MKHLLILFVLFLSACAPASPAAPTLPPPATAAPATETPIPTWTITPEPSATATPTPDPTATSTPEYGKLRVLITINMAVCHYGPGKPYLYEYGVYQGYNMEAISRDPTGAYIEVQAIGGDNPCWVNADYMEFKGDPTTLKPVMPEEVKLPPSPYYDPPAAVKAERADSEVTITWAPLVLKAGDSSEQTPYIVEAWVCRSDELVFEPVGSYYNQIKIVDEAGCDQPSRARLLAAEKHGYTRPVQIDWPRAGN